MGELVFLCISQMYVKQGLKSTSIFPQSNSSRAYSKRLHLQLIPQILKCQLSFSNSHYKLFVLFHTFQTDISVLIVEYFFTELWMTF